jgi:hypothetical protein
MLYKYVVLVNCGWSRETGKPDDPKYTMSIQPYICDTFEEARYIRDKLNDVLYKDTHHVPFKFYDGYTAYVYKLVESEE